MPYRLSDVLDLAERLWPAAGAEGWDASGLVTGSPDQRVSQIHLVVDAVSESLGEAVDVGADLVIAHHPLLLRGVTSVAETHYKGASIARLIRSGTGLLTAHTNADVVADGTSAVLARRLGLGGLTPIVPGSAPETGLGRVGSLPEPTTLGRLARRIAELLPATAGGVRVAGSYEQPVRTVAVCGGAGDGFLREPAVLAADVYVTADLRHHPASEAREQHLLGAGPALIDVSHWASEWLWLEVAAAQLRDALPEATVTVSELRTDPWDFAVVQ
jgi:dinuclear metal center YbgI/SA1388 family protein